MTSPDPPPVTGAFTPPRGWAGGHQQTIRGRVLPQRHNLARVGSSRGLLVPVSDGSGDRLHVHLHRARHTPDGRPRRPLVLLVHGLGGSAESQYVRASAYGLLAQGHNVARLDLRSAGVSVATTRNMYHAGRTQDLRDVLVALTTEPEARDNATGVPRLAVMGFSLGGSATLKLLGEPLGGLPVVAGVAVSAPLDLAVGADHLTASARGVYERYILRALRRDSLAPAADGAPRVSEQERTLIRRARRLPDFDDAVTAPRNGWADAAEYYRVNSCLQFLPRIGVPTLIVHSLDDPMIPSGPYRSVDWGALPHLRPLLTERGGHVGFHERGNPLPWYVDRAVEFLAQV